MLEEVRRPNADEFVFLLRLRVGLKAALASPAEY
jgi:hypothetical protein